MKKTSFLAAMVAVISVASLCIISVAASIPTWEEKRDPTTGYDPPPGESWSWAYQYGEYIPQTRTYINIEQDHDYDWKAGTGNYWYEPDGEKDRYHPWVYTRVWYWNGFWEEDTFALIQW